MFGITRVVKKHRSPGVRWLISVKSGGIGDFCVMGDLPSAIAMRLCWRTWSKTDYEERTGHGYGEH